MKQLSLDFNSVRTGSSEKRSAPTSWEFMAEVAGVDTAAGMTVSPYLAENLSAVFACVQVIAETVSSLSLTVYRREGGGANATKVVDPLHPVAQLFSFGPNAIQTAPEFLECMTAHCLLRGNAYAEIVRDNRGAPVELISMHPDQVSVVRFPGTRRIAYDYSDPNTGRTRRLLADEVLHLKDRSDDGIVGKSRLQRARETFGTALATERFAASTYRNQAKLSGVLMHPEAMPEQNFQRLRNSFESAFGGTGNAGKVAILEEGLQWKAISVSPEDAQMLESRKFGVEQIARLFRVPPPILGDLAGGNYSSMTELGRWFVQHCIMPWLNRWERTIERALFTDDARQRNEVQFDTDDLLRGDMLTRFQAYRIGREVGIYSANELREFEGMNPRTDQDAETFLSPLNMQSEQKATPKNQKTEFEYLPAKHRGKNLI